MNSDDMQTLDDLRKQREAIEAQIKAKEAAMIDGVIQQVRQLVRAHNLTPAQVFGSAAASAGRAKAGGRVYQYRDDKGNKWTGGRGRVPDWVKAIRDAGGDLEKFRVA
jgi:DNA-binding protein H-NS